MQKRLQKAQELFEQALKEQTDNRGEGTRYRIATSTTGVQYVVAERFLDIDFANPTQWESQVKSFIYETIRKQKDLVVISTDGLPLTIGKEFNRHLLEKMDSNVMAKQG